MAVLNTGLAKVLGGPQTIAPSSNDWDYTYAVNYASVMSYPASGNALGDGTEGGNIDPIGVNAAVYSLHTFDGDFEIEWEQNGSTMGYMNFGVHAIDEDDDRSVHASGGMASMTNSFWYRSEVVADFMIGGSAQSDTHTWVAGSTIKITRVDETITFYDDGSSVHEFDTDYSGAMRFCIGGDGNNHLTDMDDIFFTDTDKVQRDGCINRTVGGSSGSSISVGAGGPNDYNGSLIPITRSGEITTVKFKISGLTTSFNSHVEVWTHDGTNPLAQIGGDSSGVNITGTGTKTYTFTTKPTVVKDTFYWFIIVDDDGTGVADCVTMDDTADGMEGGRGNSIGAINTTALSSVFQCEVVVDTSDGEPSPDHETLLLIHSEGADGNQDFDDSSQYNRTDTPSGNVHHDNQQAHFGSTSIQFDGTGDYISYPDSADWQLGDVHTDFTVDFWIYLDGLGTDEFVVAHATSFSWSGINWYFNRDSGTNRMTLYYGNSGSTGMTLTTTTALSATTWHHVAVTKSSEHFTIYLNGTAEATADNAYTGTSIATPLLVGIGVSATNPLNGRIEELRISKVARWDDDFDVPTAPYPTD